MLMTSRNCSAWTAGSLKYLINCSSWAVGRDAGSLLCGAMVTELFLVNQPEKKLLHSNYPINREVASCSGIGMRGSILWTPSSSCKNGIEFGIERIMVVWWVSTCLKQWMAMVEQVVGGGVGACASQMAFTPLVNRHRPLLLPLLIYIN